MKKVRQEHITAYTKNILREILTIIDLASFDNEQRKALKNLIKRDVWESHNKFINQV